MIHRLVIPLRPPRPEQRILRRVPDVAMPLEPRRPFLAMPEPVLRRMPAPWNVAQPRVPDVRLPVEAARGAFRATPDRAMSRHVAPALLARRPEVAAPAEVFPRPRIILASAAASVPGRAVAPWPNRRVPDVRLPTEPRRPLLAGGHSKRLPDFTGVRI